MCVKLIDRDVKIVHIHDMYTERLGIPHMGESPDLSRSQKP